MLTLPSSLRVFAKTGGISNVSGLAGYVTTRSGRRLAFALHVNHFVAPQAEAGAAMDAIALILAGQ